jgi:photosystem II stability/assembly factor-like uncharacterized protein
VGLAVVAAVAVMGAVIMAPATTPIAKTKRASGALHALELWANARAYPGKVIPDVGHAAAFAYSKATLAGGALDRADGGVDPWQEIGPHNIGGRTLAVAMNPQNPQTLWAGAASGGLWRTFNTGVGPDAWDLVDTGFPVLGVSSIAIAPQDSNTLFIGTGEVYGYQNALGGLAIRLTRGSYGIGILKTTDGGQTWNHSLDWSYNQKRGIASLAMHPTDPDIVYAGTTEGVYKTTDGGASWVQVHDVLMAMHVVIDRSNPDRVYVACGDLGSPGTGLYRSTNAGQNWTHLTTGLPSTWSGKGWLDIYEASPNVIYASLAQSESGIGLYRSLDYGDSWQLINTTDYATYQGWYSHWVHVDPTDSTHVLCAGVDIYRSTNGGRTLSRASVWSNWYFGNVPPGGPEGPPDYAHADHHAVIHDPARPDTLYFGTDGGVFLSTDGGQTFAGRNGGYQSTQFYNGFSSALLDNNLAIGGMQDNATAIYEGNLGWRRVIGGDGCWTAMHPLQTNIMFGTSQYLAIRKSTNTGQSFNSATSGIGSDDVAFAAPYVLSPAVPNIMYAGRTKIYRTSNGASSWSATNSNLPLDGNMALAMGISPLSPDWVYVGTAPTSTRAGVFLTTNSGVSWTNVTGNLPDRYPIDIAVDPVDHTIAYVAFSGFGTGHLFRTTDAGASWSDLSTALPDVPSSAILVDPDYPNVLYFGNDVGVYASTDAGQTWQEYMLGMPSASIVMDLSVVRLERRIRAVTHGNGVYERPLIDPSAGMGEPEATPAAGLRLFAATPNPFARATTIRFAVDQAIPVSVHVYDITGRAVATLLDGRVESGEHTVVLDASRLGLAAGVYIARVEARGEVQSQRLVLAR